MRIGYSFWGFLGPGITDTPDGGRSHRRTLVDGLRAAGHQIVFLQRNRDLIEAGTDLRAHYLWAETDLPDLDALFLEWRWPIPGRNTLPCGQPNHTCDLHRQQQLIDHYTARGVRTIIWDKDQQLAPDDPLRGHPAVTVCTPALYPPAGTHSLLFPVADIVLDRFDPAPLVRGRRPWPLVYVGNQYDRDMAFDSYFAPAARHLSHQVAGKWSKTDRWPHVKFLGRIPFCQVEQVYREGLTTLLLLPERYARTGQMTQRLFEAILAGCLPLAPTTIRGIERYVPSSLHVQDGQDVTRKIGSLRAAPEEHRAELLISCARRLDLFRLTRQVSVLDSLLTASRPRTTELAR